MKIVVEKTSLLKVLSHIQSIVERKNTIPILSNVLLNAESGALSLTATDMDIEIIDSIDAEIVEAGSTTVPAHTLYDIVRKLEDGSEIRIEQNDSVSISIFSGKSKFNLGCLPSEDFPVMSNEDCDFNFSLSINDLTDLIDKTKFAISTEETRYYLNGVFFHEKEGKLVAVSTDGHRLAKVAIEAPAGSTGMPGVIVPRKTVLEIRKLADEFDGAVNINLSENKIIFSADSIKFTSKLIDGTFPDYERVIPANNYKELTLNPKVFASAVDRVSTIATDKTSAVSLKITKDNVNISVNAPDCGFADDEVAVSYDNDEMEIGFNSKYLIEVAGQVSGNECTFVLNDSASPALIKDTEDENTLYVLMPMRT